MTTPVDAGDVIAIYAAVVSTIVGAWQIWLSHIQNRPRLYINTSIVKNFHKDGSHTATVMLNVTNRGRAPTTLLNAQLTISPLVKVSDPLEQHRGMQLFFDKKDRNHRINPNETWYGTVEISKHHDVNVTASKLSVLVVSAHRNAPYKAKVKQHYL